MKSIYWVRNDLRWHDNRTLIEFCQQSSSGIFVWCSTPTFLRAGPIRKKFIVDSVLAFRKKVVDQGGRFIISQQTAKNTLPHFITEHSIESVFYTKETTSEEIYDELLISKQKVKVSSFDQATLIHPVDLPMSLSELPEQFTTFRKIVESRLRIHPPLPSPKTIPTWPIPVLNSWDFGSLADFPDHGHPQIQGGEVNGLNRLENYIWKSNQLKNYKETRNGLLEWDDSSKLSPWLSTGALSARMIYREIQRYEDEVIKNESTYWLFFELLWRDYFKFVALKWGPQFFTQMSGSSNKRKFSDDDQHQFELWTQGKTGDDFIDANMNELNQTGWMSNRGRQNVASYLAKTLNLDWRLGAAYFEEMLIDYDASSNWGNWAYLAGVGQDPRNRAFNSQRQASMYDPQGHYRQKFAPAQNTALNFQKSSIKNK